MRKHRFDPLSFVFGVLFLGVAVLGLTRAATLTIDDLRWVGPGVLVLLGTALVATAARRDDHGESPSPASPAPTDRPQDAANTRERDGDVPVGAEQEGAERR